MKKEKQIFATTHIVQGSRFTRKALENMAEQINNYYLPLDYEHDIRHPPLWRIISAKVIPLSEGEYALEGTVEIFEDYDSPELLNGDGRKMVIKDYSEAIVSIYYDHSFNNKKGQKLICNLSNISENIETGEMVKRSAEPISILTIALGSFIAGSIMSGFFSKIGSDAYDKLKKILIKYYGKDNKSKSILDISFLVKKENKPIEMHLLIINPSKDDIDNLFNSKFEGLENLISSIPLNEDISQIVLEYKDSGYLVRYGVRDDCVPLTYVISKEKVTEKIRWIGYFNF